MQSQAQIDQILRQKSDAREIPGVVAIAASSNEVIYQGAFGKREYLPRLHPAAAVLGDRQALRVETFMEAPTGPVDAASVPERQGRRQQPIAQDQKFDAQLVDARAGQR